MRNRYDRTNIVIHAPIAERRGRTFERKLDEAEGRGFVVVGHPTFTIVNIDPFKAEDVNFVLFGTVLMRKSTTRGTKPKI